VNACTFPFSNKIEDISTPSIILSVGIGISINFEIVGNKSTVAANYINYNNIIEIQGKNRSKV